MARPGWLLRVGCPSRIGVAGLEGRQPVRPLLTDAGIAAQNRDDARHELQLPDLSQHRKAGPLRDVEPVPRSQLGLSVAGIIEAQLAHCDRGEIPLPGPGGAGVEVADDGTVGTGYEVAQER